ncbi:MAG: hypothetical protein R3212_11530, partial [Xanthomonadales bacterium]|nr:hypothetical protein [Xanthomonadales bacterium]
MKPLKYITRLLGLLLLAGALQTGVAADGQGEYEGADEGEVNHLDLAALMLRDGNFDRAIATLDQVNPEEEGLDLERYYTLRGLAHLRRKELELSRDALLHAADTEAPDALVFIYLAQVNFQLEDYRQTLDALDRAGDAVT